MNNDTNFKKWLEDSLTEELFKAMTSSHFGIPRITVAHTTRKNNMSKETLEIEKKYAQKAFNESDSKGQAILKKLFGEKIFSEKITDRVKTFEDAWEIYKEDLSLPETIELATLLSYKGKNKDLIASQAHLKLTIIIKVLNEGWEPDWSNSNQNKYYRWFKYTAGFGFSDSRSRSDHSDTIVGSRLVFEKPEVAEYAATQFKDLFNQLFTL